MLLRHRAPSPLRSLFGRLGRCLRRDRRGNVALLFAVALLPIVMLDYIAVDMSRLADGRATLQRAVDTAALSGAAAYSLNTTTYNTLATTIATTSFCNVATALPEAFSLVSSGGSTPEPCPSTPGATISAGIGGYVRGTPGADANSGCTATNTVISGVECGFVITVTATATMNTSLPRIFGTRTISATGVAFNPFINLTNALTAVIQGSAYNTNSIWVYPVLLDSQGNLDFTTNAGAIPGLVSGVYPADASPSGCTSLTACGSTGTAAGINCLSNTSATACQGNAVSGCTDSPFQYTCGNFVMIADTAYTTAVQSSCSSGCWPNGYGNYPEFINGVVQSPAAPPAVITATTPIAFAFLSIAGGNFSYSSGYNGGSPAGYSGTYLAVQPYNGCTYSANSTNYPNFPGNGVYTTSIQYYGNSNNDLAGGYPAADWPKVSHWFYSSYLMNGLPPSQGEILSQSNGLLTYTYPNGKNGQSLNYNTRVALAGSNSSGSFSPSLSTCDQLATGTYANDSYDEFYTTAYPTASNPASSRASNPVSASGDNASLYIIRQPVGTTPLTYAQTGYYQNVFTPSNTPGASYSALSCQAYGNFEYTFYWNDMGGSQTYGDDQDYNNGTVTVQCNGPSFVVLIG